MHTCETPALFTSSISMRHCAEHARWRSLYSGSPKALLDVQSKVANRPAAWRVRRAESASEF
eukprot:365316-Chlamydomonas_euryale.AAC.2